MAANGGSRGGVVVLSLVIGAGVGYWIGAGQGKSAVKAADARADAAQKTTAELLKIQFNPLVIVGPTASTLRPDVDIHLSFSKKQQMTWRSDSGQPLSIIFPESKFPKEANGLPPFEDMHPVKQSDGKVDWMFIHPFGTNVAVSPTINHELEKLLESTSLTYAYDQELAGDRKDGRIIIDK